MSFYVVTMEHPDGPEWARHVGEHVRYLQELVTNGLLVASGPLKGLANRAGFLIFRAADRGEVDAAVKQDPFARFDVIAQITIAEWDPLFGAFAAESSGDVERLVASGQS